MRWASVVLSLMAPFTIVACSSESPAAADQRLVFCLAEDRRSDLVAAAVVLEPSAAADDPGLVRVPDGRELTPVQWRIAQPESFDRACRALNPPRSAGQPNQLVSSLLPFGTALVAALLTFVGSRLRDITLRGEQQARALRVALSPFVSATEDYVREWESGPAQTPQAREVHDRRADLRMELRRVTLIRPRATLPGTVLATLSNELGEGVTNGWHQDNRANRAAEVRAALSSVERSVDTLAHALERPVRQRRLLSDRPAPDAP